MTKRITRPPRYPVHPIRTPQRDYMRRYMHEWRRGALRGLPNFTRREGHCSRCGDETADPICSHCMDELAT